MFLRPQILLNQSPRQNLMAFAQFKRALALRGVVPSSSTSSLLVVNKNLQWHQEREYQSAKRWDNAGFLDTIVGIYEDPNYKLDLKAEEMRDGQPLHYLSEFGVMIVSVPAACAIFLAVSMLTWYTFFDTQPTFLRSNPNPFLLINSGKDYNTYRNPILSWTYPYGPHNDNKIRFYFEIKDAIERKNKIKEALKQAK